MSVAAQESQGLESVKTAEGSAPEGVSDLSAMIFDASASRSRLALPGIAIFLLLQSLYDFAVYGAEPGGAFLVFCSLVASLVVCVGIYAMNESVLPDSVMSVGVAGTAIALASQIGHAAWLVDAVYCLPLLGLQMVAGTYLLRLDRLKILMGATTLAWAGVAGSRFGLETWVSLAMASAVAGYWTMHVASAGIEALEERLEETRASEAAEEQRVREVELEKETLARSQRAIDGAGDGYWHWDLTTDDCVFSTGWARMLGFEPREVGNRPEEWLNRIHAHYLPQVKEDLSAHLFGQTPRLESQFRLQKRDGSYIWAFAKGATERDEEGNPLAVSGTLIDITHLVTAEKSMINETYEDRLTGLANRKALTIRLDRALERMKQERYLFGVIFMDLDRFKVINDCHGHLVGDQLLAAVASRLRNCLREHRGDLLARFGGDEFVAVVEDLREPEEAMVVARRFQEALRVPFRIGDLEIVSGGSVGVAFNTTNVESASDLLRNADTAMYRAKEEGKGEIQVFNAAMHAETVRMYAMESDLGRALDRNQFVMVYQPIVSLQTGKIVAAEGLLRWRRSENELVGPAEFIPLAEENGSIEAIGEWALEHAIRQNARWQREGLQPIKVSVNLSAKQFRSGELATKVRRLLIAAMLEPRWLDLELTETALMENLKAASEMIARLKELGVSLSIDDFGTGYSSLGYLRRFPFNSLKMDRSFVADMTSDPKSLAVAKGLIRLAHNLKLRVTAEGVESEEQLTMLGRFGCDQAQGYLASRPIGADEFRKLLQQGRPLVSLTAGPGAPATPAAAKSAGTSDDLTALGAAVGDSTRPARRTHPPLVAAQRGGSP